MANRALITTFDYNDVSLVPAECRVASRSEVDITTKFGPREFKLPVVPANMSTIVDEDLCVWLAENGYFYVMHRFNVGPVRFTERMVERGLYSSVSFGVQPVDFATVESWPEHVPAPEYATIDIAHGDAPSVARMIRALRSKFAEDTFIIAGNVATLDGARRLEQAGADAVKVGVAPGAACSTAMETGFGTRGWQLSAVEKVAYGLRRAAVVADGGVRLPADIAKSVAFGADMVMIGSMLGGHDENPGEIVEVDGERFMVFFGSASEHQKGEHKHVEGIKLNIPYRGSIATTLTRLEQSLKSAVSYAGGTQLSDLLKVEYVIL